MAWRPEDPQLAWADGLPGPTGEVGYYAYFAPKYSAGFGGLT